MENIFPLNFNTLIAIGGVIFSISYAVEKFRSGGYKAEQDNADAREHLITQLNEQLKAQKEINDSLRDQMLAMQGQVNNLTQQLGVLQGENNANDQKIKEYLQIIANRNPELEQTLTQLDALIRQVIPFMADVKNWHTDIRQKLEILDHGATPDQPRAARPRRKGAI